MEMLEYSEELTTALTTEDSNSWHSDLGGDFSQGVTYQLCLEHLLSPNVEKPLEKDWQRIIRIGKPPWGCTVLPLSRTGL